MKSKSCPLWFVPVLAGVLHCQSASAELIVYEGFDYTLGTTLTNIDGSGTDANGGSGFNAAWNNRTDVIVTGLTDSRSASAGGGIGNAANVNLNTRARTFDGTAYNTDDNSDLWFSVVVSGPATPNFAPNPNERLEFFSAGATGSQTNGFGIEFFDKDGATGSPYTPTIRASIGSTDDTASTAAYAAGQLFILGRFVNSTSGDDLLQLWLNPTQEVLNNYGNSSVLADLGTISTSVLANIGTGTGTGQVNFSATSSIFMRANNVATWTVDEIRLGTNFGDVANFTAVPEPTSALAGLLLACGLMRRRRSGR